MLVLDADPPRWLSPPSGRSRLCQSERGGEGGGLGNGGEKGGHPAYTASRPWSRRYPARIGLPSSQQLLSERGGVEHMPTHCTCRTHAVHILCTCRAHAHAHAHAVHMPCTCRAHAVHIPWLGRHAGGHADNEGRAADVMHHSREGEHLLHSPCNVSIYYRHICMNVCMCTHHAYIEACPWCTLGARVGHVPCVYRACTKHSQCMRPAPTLHAPRATVHTC